MKEHPFVVTSSFTADDDTITYDKNAQNRSTAVGRAFTLNADGKATLTTDGDEIIGKVIAVDPDGIMTGAYLCGGLRLPLGSGATVARGNRLVGALGPRNAKGYVKAVPDAPAAVATNAKTDHDNSSVNNAAATATALNATNTALNAAATALNSLSQTANKGRGFVIDYDDTHALAALF